MKEAGERGILGSMGGEAGGDGGYKVENRVSHPVRSPGADADADDVPADGCHDFNQGLEKLKLLSDPLNIGLGFHLVQSLERLKLPSGLQKAEESRRQTADFV
jgi:hypothetical protein